MASKRIAEFTPSVGDGAVGPSPTRRSASASGSPATPTSPNAQRQLSALAIHPPSSRPSADPTGMPSENTASERARRPGGTRSAISAWLGATPPASPIPTTIRATNSEAKPVAAPHTAVAALHTATDPAITFTRPRRSASRASGIASVE